jgi:hypothetical protein
MKHCWGKIRQCLSVVCRRILAAGLGSLLSLTPAARAETFEYDVVIYGGTSAAVTAAVQCVQMGKSVVIVSPEAHLGGMSSSGLGWSDTGNKAVIGGLSRQFYHRLWMHYEDPNSWRQQTRGQYGNQGQGTPAMDGQQRTMWIFEPHAAEQAFEDWVDEYGIDVHRGRRLDREKGVRKNGSRIFSITTLEGDVYRAGMFVDATYEGDLMAAAGVSYHVGRESNSVYGETCNGAQPRRPEEMGQTLSDNQRRQGPRGHYFAYEVSPYVVPDDPNSGLLPGISSEPVGAAGQGDRRIQAYNYRMCLTRQPDNRVPFPKPANYDPQRYELLLRTLLAGSRHVFGKFDPIPNLKTDTNNHGPFSTDHIGANYDYPEADYSRRQEILQEHRDYQQGYLYFLANDPRVPEDVREFYTQWGLAKDEFADNGHWPYQIYVREARRMVSDFVITELHLTGKKPTARSIGMGSYNMDSHHTQRYIAYNAEGRAYVQNEGDVQVNPGGPYAIDYGAMVPKRDQCTNLLVPVCVSSSHIAYGSIRMEPVFMILGQSAATAACLAIDASCAAQDIDYAVLRQRLLKDGQVLEKPVSQ